MVTKLLLLYMEDQLLVVNGFCLVRSRFESVDNILHMAVWSYVSLYVRAHPHTHAHTHTLYMLVYSLIYGSHVTV